MSGRYPYRAAAILLALLACLGLRASSASAAVSLTQTEGGFHFEFTSELPYMLLRYCTDSESGTLVLPGDEGRYTGDVPLMKQPVKQNARVEVSTPAGLVVEKANLPLKPEAVKRINPDRDAVRKVTDLALIPGDKAVGIRFTAPGHHQVIVRISSAVQKMRFTLNEAENGVFDCTVPLRCVYPRDLVTVTVQSLNERTLAKGDVRTLFSPIDAGETAPEGPLHGVKVCIDPGHQALPVYGGRVYQYPGSDKLVSGGNSTMAQGNKTQRKESVAVLEISYHLCRLLREAGAEVVMTRWEEEASVTNMERAEYANAQNADYFLRIHLNNSSDHTQNGVYVYGPSRSPYARSLMPIERYRDTAQTIADEMVASTRVRGGCVRMSDQFVGSNYAKMVTFLIECGFLSTPANDWILTTSDYQIKIARGIVNGLVRVVRGDLEPYRPHQ